MARLLKMLQVERRGLPTPPQKSQIAHVLRPGGVGFRRVIRFGVGFGKKGRQCFLPEVLLRTAAATLQRVMGWQA